MVVNRNFRRCLAVKGIKKFTVIKEHGFLVLPARHRIVNVHKFVGTGKLVPANLKYAAFPDCLNGNRLLYAFRDNKPFPVLPENVVQCLNHAVSIPPSDAFQS